MRRGIGFVILLAVCVGLRGQTLLDNIISDVYEQLTEIGEVDYEELQSDLIDIAANPINLNTAHAEDLEQLRFLSNQQIDAILLYVYQHPMQDLAELQLIPSLEDYTVRNLCAFVTVAPAAADNTLYAREVFKYAKHELAARIDIRNIESYEGDPVYAQLRYKFNYRNRVQFGFNLRRPTGARASDMQYGGYLQLNDIGPMRTVVAGNYQASFGQGLVLASVFRTGKNNYVLTAGNATEGLRKYGGTDGEGLHGVGATARLHAGATRLDVSALYSMQRANDSVWHHMLGANLTLRYKRLKIGLTAVENLYSDSVAPYRNMRYNKHYFRGDKQAVIGLNFRYNHGVFDLFGEVAAAQNSRWGIGTEVGGRITPTQGVGLILLYRYYSPMFDNTLGYAFSETSRLNDENGGYIGLEITRLHQWRFAAYGDVFRFSDIKYGIPYAPSWGYDAMFDATYSHSQAWNMQLRLRAREKARRGTYSWLYRFNWADNGWRLRTQCDANLVGDSTHTLTWGVSLYQDIEYTFARVPLTIQVRLQGFDARNWNNRFYCYENDVLYAFSTPAIYGQGGRAYFNIRWQIIPQLRLYLKVSETIYSSQWAAYRHYPCLTRTDIHLLLRAAL